MCATGWKLNKNHSINRNDFYMGNKMYFSFLRFKLILSVFVSVILCCTFSSCPNVVYFLTKPKAFYFSHISTPTTTVYLKTVCVKEMEWEREREKKNLRTHSWTEHAGGFTIQYTHNNNDNKKKKKRNTAVLFHFNWFWIYSFFCSILCNFKHFIYISA